MDAVPQVLSSRSAGFFFVRYYELKVALRLDWPLLPSGCRAVFNPFFAG